MLRWPGSRTRPATDRFDLLLRPHIAWLFRLASRFCAGPEDAEDLVQELLTRLYPRTAELAQVEQLRPWLAKSLYHQFIDMRRQQARSPLSRQQLPAADENDPLASVVDEGPGVERLADQALTQERLAVALGLLPPEQRAVLALHDIEGHTLPELALIMDCPVGTLKSRLHRARTRLRQLLMEPFPPGERVRDCEEHDDAMLRSPGRNQRSAR